MGSTRSYQASQSLNSSFSPFTKPGVWRNGVQLFFQFSKSLVSVIEKNKIKYPEYTVKNERVNLEKHKMINGCQKRKTIKILTIILKICHQKLSTKQNFYQVKQINIAIYLFFLELLHMMCFTHKRLSWVFFFSLLYIL